MRVALWDAHAGVAGDMWVGALIGAGLDLEAVREVVRSLELPGVEVDACGVHRAGMAATHFQVAVDPATPRSHRHLADCLEVVARADIPDPAKVRARQVFTWLGEAEAAAHDIPIERVHFHEVGADDTIVDIVCACFGMHTLGLEKVYASRVEVGTGTVTCEHGVLPVPAPGALHNLVGVPVRSSLPGERTTPTGAALLRTFVDAYQAEIDWTPTAVGLGAGTRDDAGRPNVLRVTLGESGSVDRGDSALIEMACNLDTATGEHVGWLIDRLLHLGCRDAWVVPAFGKKGRPVHVLHVLSTLAQSAEVEQFLLEESSSLGVRRHAVERGTLERWQENRETAFGAVAFKCARLPSGSVVARPEADEVARIAESLGVSRREVEQRLSRP